MTDTTASDQPAPRPSRPHMPGYPILAADEGMGLLPWSWAEERFAASRNYWVATTRPGGAPHLMPVWGVWVDQRFVFSTGAESRKTRNLGQNVRCSVSTERADEAVILEGTAERVQDPELLRRAGERYQAKYNWELSEGQGPIFAVRPRVVFGFIENEDQFTGSATRWLFDGG